MAVGRRRLTENQRQKIEDTTYVTLDRLLKFRLTYDLTNQLIADADSRWKATEDRLHMMTYPINGTGVIAYRDELQNENHKRFIVDDEPLDPAEATEILGDFPLDAAGVNYIFTLLEIYGNSVVSVVNKNFFAGKKDSVSWHHKVWGNADVTKTELLMKMAAGFAEPFKRTREEVSIFAVTRMIALKNARNSFSHEADQNVRFDALFSFVVDIVCEIYFMLMPQEDIIVQYPFTDNSERFTYLIEVKRTLQQDREENGDGTG